MSPTPRWLKIEAFNRADGDCEAMCSPRCSWRGTDVHHRKKRSQGGQHTLENVLFVCRECHQFIESSPAWSYERGLLIHGWGEIEWPPNYYRGRMKKKGGAHASHQGTPV